MKTVRNITVKALFNPDEFIAFQEQCKKSDKPQSRALRELAINWTNSNRQLVQMECPGRGQVMASRGRTRFHRRL